MKQHRSTARSNDWPHWEESKHIIKMDRWSSEIWRETTAGEKRRARIYTVAHRRAMGDWQAGREQRNGGAAGGGALGHGGEVVGRHGAEQVGADDAQDDDDLDPHAWAGLVLLRPPPPSPRGGLVAGWDAAVEQVGGHVRGFRGDPPLGLLVHPNGRGGRASRVGKQVVAAVVVKEAAAAWWREASPGLGLRRGEGMENGLSACRYA
jgi:hypothetical protein